MHLVLDSFQLFPTECNCLYDNGFNVEGLEYTEGNSGSGMVVMVNPDWDDEVPDGFNLSCSSLLVSSFVEVS